jgi:integrase
MIKLAYVALHLDRAARPRPAIQACQTGLRATELITLTIGYIHLGTGAHISCTGKGRKQRITPLPSSTAHVLQAWLAQRGGLPADLLIPTRRGTALSRDALERRVAKDAAAATACPDSSAAKCWPSKTTNGPNPDLIWAWKSSPPAGRPPSPICKE